MARRAVGIGDMADSIMGVLRQYSEAAEEDIQGTALEVAKEAKEKLQQDSPEGKGNRKGHYKDGWTYSVKKPSQKINITIYNKKKPGLTHLLENGHAKRGGGHVDGIEHIATAEAFVAEEYEKRLKVRLSR